MIIWDGTASLAAVNAGEINLGVNSADTGALVLNVASNASAVNGSIENVMMAVNGSMGSASTTVRTAMQK